MGWLGAGYDEAVSPELMDQHEHEPNAQARYALRTDSILLLCRMRWSISREEINDERVLLKLEVLKHDEAEKYAALKSICKSLG